jgi:hypothetical protein
MAVAVKTKLDFKATGVHADIPSNNIARLMYYLRSVSSCLDNMVKKLCEGLSFDPTDYSAYSSLSEDEKKVVVVLAGLLNPEVMMENKVFIPVPAGSSCLNGSSNEFYEITQAKSVLAAVPLGENSAVVINGKSINIQSIMVTTESWLRNNWINPMQSESWRVTGGPKPVTTTPRPKPVRPPSPDHSSEEEVNHAHCILCFCTGGLWCPFWLCACAGCCCQNPCS